MPQLYHHHNEHDFDRLFLLLRFFVFGIASVIIWYFILTPLIVNSADKNILLEQDEILRLINEERAIIGFDSLQINTELTQIAQAKVEDMDRYNYFSHTNPKGFGFKHFLLESDYNYLIAGENLAINYNDNKKIVEAWMNSRTHRENMLNPIFEDIGLYYEIINIDGQNHLVVAIELGIEIN